jgi:PAS domain-containing protein
MNSFYNVAESSDLKTLSSLAFMESPSASLIIDINGIIVKANKVFSHLTGYNETVNKPMSFLIKEKITTISINDKQYFISTQEDITEHTNFLNRQMLLATHDPLTDLANRLLCFK